MLVDGNGIAADIQADLKKRLAGRIFKLVVIQVGSDAASSKFIEKKRAFGQEIGIEVKLQLFPDTISEELLSAEVQKFAADESVQGIVVQLPLPKLFNTQKMLDLVPPEKDPDALSSTPLVLPPVAAAVAEILKRHDIDVRGKRALVVGRGRLVGKPVSLWLENAGARVETLGIATAADLRAATLEASIIVTGAGVPRLLAEDMIQEGVVLIDAGTSESAVPTPDGRVEKKLVGDIDPACAEKASLYTPVPGGIGPVTVAKLFENLATLVERKNEQGLDPGSSPG